jgi:carbamoyl-phosphate synthase large subunit
MNILITAGSRRVPLVQAFRHALRSLRLPGAVIVTDVNPLSPAVHVADRAYRVPLASDADFLPELLGICESEQIRLVVPTIDDELPLFGREHEQFAAMGIVVAASSEGTALLCEDKFATCAHLTASGVAAARTYLPASVTADIPLPLFIKPRVGRGAVGAFPIRSQRELEFFRDYVPDPIIQEYLDGPEFTIDVLCDFSGRPLSIVPRERVVIRAGVIDRGRTVNDARLIDLAKAACAAIRFAGPVNIQCRMRTKERRQGVPVDSAEPVIFEINPRFSGGIPLTIQAGADFPRLLIMLAAGQRVDPIIGQFRPELWMTSFESSFFLDASRVRLETCAPRQVFEDVA